jgi:hypothetical protein
MEPGVQHGQIDDALFAAPLLLSEAANAFQIGDGLLGEDKAEKTGPCLHSPLFPMSMAPKWKVETRSHFC